MKDYMLNAKCEMQTKCWVALLIQEEYLSQYRIVVAVLRSAGSVVSAEIIADLEEQIAAVAVGGGDHDTKGFAVEMVVGNNMGLSLLGEKMVPWLEQVDRALMMLFVSKAKYARNGFHEIIRFLDVWQMLFLLLSKLQVYCQWVENCNSCSCHYRRYCVFGNAVAAAVVVVVDFLAVVVVVAVSPAWSQV